MAACHVRADLGWTGRSDPIKTPRINHCLATFGRLEMQFIQQASKTAEVEDRYSHTNTCIQCINASTEHARSHATFARPCEVSVSKQYQTMKLCYQLNKKSRRKKLFIYLISTTTPELASAFGEEAFCCNVRFATKDTRGMQ